MSYEHFNKDRRTSIRHYELPTLSDKEELVHLVHMIDFAKQNKQLHEQLFQLYQHGPVWDGDVISKSDRSELLVIGACAKVCFKGEDGFNACTYFGRELLQIYDWLFGSYDKLKFNTIKPIEPMGEYAEDKVV